MQFKLDVFLLLLLHYLCVDSGDKIDIKTDHRQLLYLQLALQIFYSNNRTNRFLFI